MSFDSPVIPLVQRGTIQPDHFGKRLSEYGNSLKQQNEQWLAQQFLSEERRNLKPIVV
jgi:glutathione synthase/RimK-type ligase-like ATP-grasp enzyme